jgi:hypothetical protein
LQVKPQVAPLHVGVAFAGTGQGEQELPQLWVELLSSHWLLHACQPESHVKPQLVPLQVAVECVGGVQGVQALPQVWMDVLSAQVLPQA